MNDVKAWSGSFVLSLALAAVFPLRGECAQARQVSAGPYSMTVRGGARDSSGGAGLDLRADYLNPSLNFHVFGVYDQFNASSRIGQTDNHRYGAGLALSHTYSGTANIFAGASTVHELLQYFAHAYLGGQVKVSDWALITGSYGFGLGSEKAITKSGSRFATAQSADWGKFGAAAVSASGLKANANYYLTDPGKLDISGLEGGLSYPLTDTLTLGVGGGGDLTTRTNVDRNWRSDLMLTYSFGGRVESPMTLALGRDGVAVYPVVVRRLKAAVAAASALAVSPAATTNLGCSNPASVFTASGGKPPYAWSSTDLFNAMTVVNAAQASWKDASDSHGSACGHAPGGVTVTVTDANGATASTVITIP